ncbi:TolC family protein [bacterium]|nr:TolC family protein [bacterium]
MYILKNISMIFFILLFLCLNHANCAEVQKGSIEKVYLTFEQAYELMLENNNSLKAYNELINKMKYEKRSAIGQFFPKIGLNATYLHFSEDMTLTSSGSMRLGSLPISFNANTLIQDRDVFAMGGVAIWNIFTGGKLLSNHAAARAKLEASNEKYREIKDNLTVELVKRYYGLRFLRDVVSVKKQVLDGMQQHLTDAKKLEKEGIISKSERLHADVAYSNALRDYKSAIRDVNIAEEGLKTLIKCPDVDLKNVNIEPKSLLFIYNKSDIDVDLMKENALNNNPQLKQLKSKQKIMTAKYHAKLAEYSPTFSIGAYDIAAAGHLSEALPRFAVGASVNWLLFDGLSRFNDVKAAKSEKKMVNYEIIDAQYNIECLVMKQYQELMKHKETYESSNASVDNAQEALRTASLAFKEGIGTSLQATDAHMMLSKVKIERLKALYDYDVTLADLLKTNGNTNAILNYIITSETEEYK